MNNLIDHTSLKATTLKKDVIKLCDEAKKYNFASVCINPVYVPLVKELLNDSSVKVCTVIGFPLGANTTEIKIKETKKAISDGADEIDMVINIALALEHDYELVEKEVSEVVKVCKKNKDIIVKVILETCYLSSKEIEEVSKCCARAGADFVKTSTGFGTDGAKEDDIILMKDSINDSMGIKASGGIRRKIDAKKMIIAGATRIGTSSSVNIIDGK